MPEELLSQIFLLSHRPTYPLQPDGLDTLLRVCRLWRSIAFSIPGFWSKVELKGAHDCSRRDTKEFERYELFLARFSNGPLSLELKSVRWKTTSVLEASISRLTTLYWNGGQVPTMDDWHLLGEAKQLATLKIHVTRIENPFDLTKIFEDQVIALPSLKELAITRHDYPPVILPCPRLHCPELHSLRLDGMSLTTDWWAALHSTCSPSQIKFGWVTLRPSSRFEPPAQYSSYQTLDLSLSNADCSLKSTILRCSPNIIQLCIRSISAAHPPPMSPLKFLRRFIFRFTNEFTINSDEILEGRCAWANALDNMPILAELHVIGKVGWTTGGDEGQQYENARMELHKNVLLALTTATAPPHDQNRQNNTSLRCPLLKKLALSRLEPSFPIWEIIVSLAEQRRAVGPGDQEFYLALIEYEGHLTKERTVTYTYEELITEGSESDEGNGTSDDDFL